MKDINVIVREIVNQIADERPAPPSIGMLLAGKLQGIESAPPEKRLEMIVRAWLSAEEESAQARRFFLGLGEDERLAQLWRAIYKAVLPGWLCGVHAEKKGIIDSIANAFDARQNSLVQYLQQQLAHADMKELEKAKGIELAASLGRLQDAVGPNFLPPAPQVHDSHLAQLLSPAVGHVGLAQSVALPTISAPMASTGPSVELGG